MSRFARRTDSNHAEIIEALRLRGHRVQSLAALGGGVPDLLVGTAARFGRTLVLLEVKPGDAKDKRQRQLNAREAEWHAEWRGYPVHVVGTVEQATAIVEGA